MHHVLSFGAIASLLASTAQAQDPAYVEARFHRVHLKNGNLIDGQLIRQTDKEVLLKVKYGEMTIRLETVSKVEFVKMLTLQERRAHSFEKPTLPPPPQDKPFPGGEPARSQPGLPAASVPPVDVPQEVRSRADEVLARLKKTESERKYAVMQELLSVRRAQQTRPRLSFHFNARASGTGGL